MKRVIYRYKFLGLTVKNEMVLLPDNKTVQMALTKGQYCLFDLDDLKYVIGFRWCTSKIKKSIYACTMLKLSNGKRKRVYMHKIITSPESGFVVDHINHDGLNNTRSNLRICSSAENSRNQNIRSDNTSGFKGVSFGTNKNKFKAQIQINDKKFYLGLFENPENAALAYNTAAKEFFGEFALLNDIPDNIYLSKHESKTLYRQMHKIRNYLNNQNQELENQNIQN